MSHHIEITLGSDDDLVDAVRAMLRSPFDSLSVLIHTEKATPSALREDGVDPRLFVASQLSTLADLFGYAVGAMQNDPRARTLLMHDDPAVYGPTWNALQIAVAHQDAQKLSRDARAKINRQFGTNF